MKTGRIPIPEGKPDGYCYEPVIFPGGEKPQHTLFHPSAGEGWKRIHIAILLTTD